MIALFSLSNGKVGIVGKRDGKLSYQRITRKQSMLIHEEWEEKTPEQEADHPMFFYDPNMNFSDLTALPPSDKVKA